MRQEDDDRRGRSVVSALNVHLVFVTKYRRGVLNGEHLDALRAVFTSVCADFAAELVEMDGEDDHVHLLVGYPANVAVARLVNSLKGVCARRLRQRDRVRTHREHLWTPCYFAASADGAPLETLKTYIRQQRTLGPARLTRPEQRDSRPEKHGQGPRLQRLATWAEAATIEAAQVPDGQASGLVSHAPGGEGASRRFSGGETGPVNGEPTLRLFDEAVRRAVVTRRPVHHRIRERLP
jgi:putative transposase